MKRYIAAVLLMTVLMCLLSGCKFWMDGEYFFEEPYDPEDSGTVKNAIVVSSYTQMRNAMVNLVETGAVSGIFDVSNFNGGSVRFFLDASIRYVKSSNPMGAYAVDSITYEMGTSTGEQAIALDIRYRFDRAHIMKILRSYTMEEAKQSIVDALRTFSSGAVVRISRYEEMDFQNWIASYALEYPDVIVEIPEVRTYLYPQKGSDRIISFEFDYTYTTEELRKMQEDINRTLNIFLHDMDRMTTDRERYAVLFNYLTGDGVFALDETNTPAYSVLVNKTGDSGAFASIYAVLCKKYGLECLTISGTCNDQPRTWNLIKIGERYYHFDLLQAYQNGGFTTISGDDLDEYIWDYGAYPN